MERHLEKFVLYPLAVGVLCLFVGTIFSLPIVVLMGFVGLLPLIVVIFIAAVGFVWTMADEVLPSFRGRSTVVGIIVLLFTAVLILRILGGGSGEDDVTCQTYRGVPTC